VQHTLRDIRVILTPFRFVSLSTHEKTFMIQGRLMVPVNTQGTSGERRTKQCAGKDRHAH